VVEEMYVGVEEEVFCEINHSAVQTAIFASTTQ
jgi:hypothetical protein